MKGNNMKLLTKEIRQKLEANGKQQEPVKGTNDEMDFHPVVKLFTPDGGATWLLSEIDPDNTDIAFGLCDLGLGFTELGSVCISELECIRGALGLPVERDTSFKANKTISQYADEAREHSRIVA